MPSPQTTPYPNLKACLEALRDPHLDPWDALDAARDFSMSNIGDLAGLLELLTDPDEKVRLFAISAIHSMHPPAKDVIQQVAQLAQDREPWVLYDAARVLAWADEPQDRQTAIQALRRIVLNWRTYATPRWTAFKSLAKLSGGFLRAAKKLYFGA